MGLLALVGAEAGLGTDSLQSIIAFLGRGRSVI
jgi:hypothetical protein